MSNPTGRPLKFESAEALRKAIDAYFAKCDNRKMWTVTKAGGAIETPNPAPYTVTGLANALDVDRSTLIDYESGNYDETDPSFSHTVKRAKRKITESHETLLYEGQNVAGVIFSLKNNAGWKDKSEQDIELHGDMTVETVSYAGAATIPRPADGKTPDPD